jgi:AraC-like DNA-binding protein
MKPLLEHASVLRSYDFEETRGYLAASAIGLELARPASREKALDARVNGLFLPSVVAGYIEYCAAVTLRYSPRSSPWLAQAPHRKSASGDYWLYLPRVGRIEMTIGRDVYESDARRGILVSPLGDTTLRSGPGTARLGLAVRGDTLNRHLSALLGDAPRSPLRFQPVLDVAAGHGRRLAHVLRWALGEFERDGLLDHPLITGRFESFIVDALLLFQPNNYSEALARRRGRIASRDVKRARDYIEAHLQQPVSLPDVAAAAGVPGRTLLQHFRNVYGVAPMRYLRGLRMQRVREELASGSAAEVAECARHWGFAHPGRFAVDYRRRFGESPSATLARGRAR